MHSQRSLCIHRGHYAFTEVIMHSQRSLCIHRGHYAVFVRVSAILKKVECQANFIIIIIL